MHPIVAFTKDWSDVPTCTTHILRRLAVDRPVLWVESIGTRRPKAGSPRDLGRILRRLRRVADGPRHIENSLWVWSPVLIPRAESRMALAINRCMLNAVVRRWLKTVGGFEGRTPDSGLPTPYSAELAPGQELPTTDCRLPTNVVDFWCFVPNAGALLKFDRLPSTPIDNPTSVDISRLQSIPVGSTLHAPCSLVYYCVDDWSQFENLDGEWLQQQENVLLQQADHVFAASRYLESKCRAVAGERVHYMPHGVDLALFRQALEHDTEIPAFFKGLPSPVIGFYGNISAWIDFELVAAVARLRPEWSFVLIGPLYADVSALRALPNVYFPGRVEHEQLPGCCKAFNAAMIPYDMRHPRMQSVNPVKARELLAAGVPVVSCNIPEVRECGNGVQVVEEARAEAWVAALEQALQCSDRPAVSQSVSNDDWDARVREMLGVSGEFVSV